MRKQDDKFCLFKRLIESQTSENKHQQDSPRDNSKTKLVSKYQHLISNMTKRLTRGQGGHSMLIVPIVLVSITAIQVSLALGSSVTTTAGSPHQLVAQARAGGLDPSDYIDEAGELDIMMNQQTIPTAQLMSAAGHIVPDNFFLPGGSIPAIYSRYNAALAAQQQQAVAAALAAAQQQSSAGQHHHQHQQQQQQPSEQLQQAASQVHARHVPQPTLGRSPRSSAAALDLLAAAAEQQQQQQQHQDSPASLIDFNGYSLTTSPDGRDGPPAMDLVEFLGSPVAPSGSQQQQAATMAALYEQQLAAAVNQHHQHQHSHQQHQSQQQQYNDQQAVAELSALASNQHQQRDQDVSASNEQQTQAEQYSLGSSVGGSAIGPDYQIDALGSLQEQYASYNGAEKNGQSQQRGKRPFGLPTKSSDKEPSDMLKPLGNPKTISSPVIDFVANNAPKGPTTLEKLAEKIPQTQTPTVFSFSSSKDPVDKVKSVNQKKRNVMRQAEQLARLLIKSVNDKFGTNLGDQTDIPFLLSSVGPLGFAQNLLLDPTLLVTLLNTAEKTYFSDILPGPAKSAIRPVLNIFRVPNKKRDKANLLNIISYLTSGGQSPSSPPSKHRQSFGIEKSTANKNKNSRR